jgi:hypothetical protein
MVPTNSVQVGLEWHGTKYRWEYLASTWGLWSAAVARLVFPIPPAPRMATWADSWIRMLTTSSSSDWRPWKIFGMAGSRLNDPELIWKSATVDCYTHHNNKPIAWTWKSSNHLNINVTWETGVWFEVELTEEQSELPSRRAISSSCCCFASFFICPIWESVAPPALTWLISDNGQD